MKFGEKIRCYRENNNLTQKDLGDQLHLTDDAIYKWEAGKSFPDVPMLRNLVELTGYDAETLTNDNRSIEAYYGLPVSAKTFLYEKTINARDSVHEIYDIGLRKGVKLHRFTNRGGEEYSAIYCGSNEIFSCPRKEEKEMIYYWNTNEINF